MHPVHGSVEPRPAWQTLVASLASPASPNEAFPAGRREPEGALRGIKGNVPLASGGRAGDLISPHLPPPKPLGPHRPKPHSLPPSPQVWEDPEDGAGMRFAVPALFTGSLPPALVQALPEALCGHRKKYDFSVLPSDFFPRCLARVSRCVQRLFVGPAHFPDDARTCDANAFWADGAWIQDTECTRALMRLSGRTLHLHFNGNPGEPQSPATLLVAGLHNVVAGLASEYRGMVVSEAVHCPAPACRHWLEVGKELPPGAPPNVGVVCPACGGVFKYDQVTLQRPPNPAERRARALKGLVDDPQVSPARRERLQGLLARYCGPALTEAEEVCFLDSLVEALLQP